MESREDLNRLLLWLGEDTTVGARKYEEVRGKLIFLFRSRGCSAPEELADETIDRTARAISRPGFSFEGRPIAYFRGVARNVHLESLRQNRRFIQEPIEWVAEQKVLPEDEDSNTEECSECLEKCLGKLPDEKRMLLLNYYEGERRSKIAGRQHLADVSGTGMNALRIQVHRLRKIVRSCVERCVRAYEM
jgi:DNA-directed RNA polymerase specialized sigma24 family protein